MIQTVERNKGRTDKDAQIVSEKQNREKNEEQGVRGGDRDLTQITRDKDEGSRVCVFLRK